LKLLKIFKTFLIFLFESNFHPQSQEIIRLVEGRIEDNRIFCHVERDAVSTVRGQEFDLNTKSYYMLLASGTELRENSVGYHDFAYTPSEKRVKFNK
jgi:hypothetical protein